MGKPSFSIICATYNRSSLLKRAIMSVLNQQFKDFELIIVNDGSTDETEGVVRSFKDRRIVYFKNETNRGPNHARNIGLKHASGRYIALLDDDDTLSPLALRKVNDFFSSNTNERIKMLITNCLNVEANRTSGRILEEGIIRLSHLLCGKLKGDYWIVVDKDALLQNGLFNERVTGGRLLWLSFLEKYDAYYIPLALYLAYRKHGKRITNSKMCLNAQRAEFEFSEELFKYGKQLKKLCKTAYSRKYLELAIFQIVGGKREEAMSSLFVSLRAKFSFFAIAVLSLLVLCNIVILSKIAVTAMKHYQYFSAN